MLHHTEKATSLFYPVWCVALTILQRGFHIWGSKPWLPSLNLGTVVRRVVRCERMVFNSAGMTADGPANRHQGSMGLPPRLLVALMMLCRPKWILGCYITRAGLSQ